MSEENLKINKEQADLWTGFKSLCSNHDSVLCTLDAKMNSTESKLLAKSQDFHEKITTDIKSLNEDTHSSVADMRVNLQALMKKVDSHSSNTSANLSACMDRLDKFDFEINKLANSLVSTQTELTILRSTVPPPNYQPSTLSNNGFIIPPMTPNIHVPGIMQGNNTYQPPHILDNNSDYGTLPGAQHNNPNVQGQSHFTYDNKNDDKSNATKPKEVSGKTDPAEIITDMVKQLLKDSSSAGNTQDVDLKIISIIVHVITMIKVSLIQGKITLMISNLQAVAVKSIGILLTENPKVIVVRHRYHLNYLCFQGDHLVLRGSFIAKFDRIATRKKWSDYMKLYRLFDCLSEKALEYAERAEEKDNYDKLKKELGLRFNIKDAPLAARQKLHVIKQTEEEGLEEFLQRVLTTVMDGFHVADNTTVQK